MNKYLKTIEKLESKIKAKSLPSMVKFVLMKDGKYYNEDGSEWIKPSDWDKSGNLLVVFGHPVLKELYEV